MLTRGDVFWVVALTAITFVSLRLWEFDWTRTIIYSVIVGVARLGYALYARSTWRR